MEEKVKRTNYLMVFVILAVFTLIETLVSYIQKVAIKLPALIVFSVVKAVLVLLYFMHLKFDSKIFTYFFVAGCILAIPLILAIVLIMPVITP